MISPCAARLPPAASECCFGSPPRATQIAPKMADLPEPLRPVRMLTWGPSSCRTGRPALGSAAEAAAAALAGAALA